MPPPVYSVAFWEGGLTSAGSLTTLWTVPDGHTDVLRDIDGYHSGAGTGVVYFQLDSGLTWCVAVGGDVVPFQWRGRQVATAGTVVKAQTSSASVYMRLCGYRLID